jgi:hypothetical protein
MGNKTSCAKPAVEAAPPAAATVTVTVVVAGTGEPVLPPTEFDTRQSRKDVYAAVQ